MSIGLTQKLLPINTAQEKRKFLFDPEYNPQFEYEDEIEEEDLLFHGEASEALLPTAKYILNKVHKQWSDEEAYMAETEGSLLSQTEVEQAIRSYLQRHRLDSIVNVNYSSKVVSRTSVTGNTINIRTPIQYRAQGVLGMLEHEVGVHIMRRLNDEKQPWRGHRGKFHLSPYLGTEEGLAVLHAHVIREDKLIWAAALSYYGVYLAHRMSFAQMFKELKQYVSDSERLWSLCLRCKRGLKDTSLPGGYTKNQLYLQGAVDVYRWLKQHDFNARSLYIGKVAIEDVDRLSQLSELSPDDLVLPQLLMNKEWYREQILKIGAENKFPLS